MYEFFTEEETVECMLSMCQQHADGLRALANDVGDDLTVTVSSKDALSIELNVAAILRGKANSLISDFQFLIDNITRTSP